MNFPVLSIITFTPLVAALIILMMPANRKNETRAIALASAVFALGLSAWVYFSYDQAAGGYQFLEQYNWLPALGISLYFGVDGMSTPLVLLTGVVMVTGVLISWGDDNKHVMAGIQDRPREFFAFLFILAWGVFGVFVSLDLFMLFFFYEIAVFPMYLLIAIWGWAKTREYAAMKLTLYLFLGSVVALVGALVMYWVSYQNTGVLTFDMLQMEKAGFSQAFQDAWFLPVFFGFAVLAGIWPFHNWSPD
jgi:NADH-quinone oxidoreductase subunit M